MKWLGHALLVAILTILSQIGGLAWLIALAFRRRLLAFMISYAALWGIAFALAPAFGRVALPCFGDTLRMQSPIYCLLARNYVSPELEAVARDAATKVAQEYPGTVTLALDGGFPFLDGMPLLPHMSHDDGDKLDFAFYYSWDGEYLPGVTRSPIGYWAFEPDGRSECPPVVLTARWNLPWLQLLFPDYALNSERTAALARALMADPRIGKVFLEPPLAARLGITGAKLRFQGCRAARHDDHIHAQLG
ncbi:MAG: hypothetical protein I8H94_03055 [Rhodobacteraceae bacterium]|nr:hypothetical protein [Paracoccaceae bacterium]